MCIIAVLHAIEDTDSHDVSLPQVVIVDASIKPASYVVKLLDDGSERHTELSRLRHHPSQHPCPHPHSSFADLLMDPSPEGEAPELESDVPSDTPIRRQGAHRLPEGRKPMFNFLEIIRRAVFLSAKTEPMQLPSYRAVELHVHRAELAFRLAIECVGGNQPSLHSWKAPNSGWEGTSESDIRIVWDDQVPSSTPSSCPPQRRRQQDECKCGKNGNASELCKNCVCTKNKRPCNETCCCTPQTCKNRFGRKPNSEEGHAATPSAQPPPYLQAQMSTSEAQGSEPQKQPIADEPGVAYEDEGPQEVVAYEDEEPQEDDFLAWLLPDVSVVPGEDVAGDNEGNEENRDDFYEGVGDLEDMFGIHSDDEIIGSMI